MPTFYSPIGNPEVWATKPNDYYTEAEWIVSQPQPEPLPEPTLEDLRTAKIVEINKGYNAVMAYIQADYPAEEVLSWGRQASQARELLVNPDAEAVFVRVLASQKNISVNEMRDRILRNATNWEPIAALLTAQRQIMEEAAYMAQTIADVENIKVGYSV